MSCSLIQGQFVRWSPVAVSVSWVDVLVATQAAITFDLH